MSKYLIVFHRLYFTSKGLESNFKNAFATFKEDSPTEEELRSLIEDNTYCNNIDSSVEPTIFNMFKISG